MSHRSKYRNEGMNRVHRSKDQSWGRIGGEEEKFGKGSGGGRGGCTFRLWPVHVVMAQYTPNRPNLLGEESSHSCDSHLSDSYFEF